MNHLHPCDGKTVGAGTPGPAPASQATVLTVLETADGQVPGWIRLLPRGEVPLGDGREPLRVDDEALAAMVAHFEARGLDLVVDYEHQSLTGLKAPAAGWIKELAAREDGLWARVQWTDTARDHIAAREYRYFSPVLELEEKTRRPLALLQVALTNTPAINGLDPLVARLRTGPAASSPPPDSHDPWGEVAVLLGLEPDAGPSRIRGTLLALKDNLEQLSRTRLEMEALQARMREQEIEAEVEAALAAGKIQPCQEESARIFARHDLEAFRSYIRNALPQVPIGQRFRFAPDHAMRPSPGEAGLTSRQLFICRSLGITPEAFKAQRDRLQAEALL